MRNEGVEIQQKRPVGQQTPLTPITANAFMTYEPKTVLLRAVRVKNEINPSQNAREFRKIVRNSLAV